MRRPLPRCLPVFVLVLAAALLWQPAAPTAGQVAQSVPLINKLGEIGGQVQTLALDGNLAYVGERASMTIVNISNPAQAVVLARVSLPAKVRDIALSGTLAYVAAESAGLYIYNVADPSAPLLLAHVTDLGTTRDVSIEGARAYVASHDRGLAIVDVSDPAMPALLGRYAAGIGSGTLYSRVLHVDNSIGYFIGWFGGGTRMVHIVDLQQPDQPVLLDSLNVNTPEGLAFSSDHLYIAGSSGLSVFNVADPAAAVLAGSTSGFGNILNVEVSGQRAYVKYGSSDYLGIVDISDPTEPLFIDEYSMQLDLFSWDHDWDIRVKDNLAYVADAVYGLRILNISNPANVQPVSSSYAMGEIWDLQVVGTIAYVAAAHSGLRIVDISNPALPQILAFADDIAKAKVIAVDGARLFVFSEVDYPWLEQEGSAEQPYLINIFDISSPSEPLLLGTYPTSDDVYNLEARGDVLYAVGSRGLELIAVGDPSSPTRLKLLEVGEVWDIDLISDLAYMAATSGLVVVDIADPAQPQTLLVTNDDTLFGIDVVDDLAYMVSKNSWLRIANIRNPQLPEDISRTSVSPAPYQIAVEGGIAYIIDVGGDDRLLAFDVRDPANPTLLAASAPEIGFIDLAIADDKVLIAGWWYGLQIYEQVEAPPRTFRAFIPVLHRSAP